MAFDSVIVSFTTKTDKVDLVQAAHMNSVQSELVTIETILGTAVKGDRASLKARLANALDIDGSLLSGTSFPSPSFTSQGFYRTDLSLFYVRDSSGTFQQVGQSLSATLFEYNGQIDAKEISATDLGGTGTEYYHYLKMTGSTYVTKWSTKWIKIAGVSTVTIYARIWNSDGVTGTANIRVNIGSPTGNVTGTVAQITPEWKSFTIDVSSLTNGTAYDVTADLKSPTTHTAYCSNIIAFGS